MAARRLTEPQRKAIEKLKAAKPFLVVTGANKVPHIETGINTAVLQSLLKHGLIRCSAIYLHGKTAEDLEVVTA